MVQQDPLLVKIRYISYLLTTCFDLFQTSSGKNYQKVKVVNKCYFELIVFMVLYCQYIWNTGDYGLLQFVALTCVSHWCMYIYVQGFSVYINSSSYINSIKLTVLMYCDSVMIYIHFCCDVSVVL